MADALTHNTLQRSLVFLPHLYALILQLRYRLEGPPLLFLFSPVISLAHSYLVCFQSLGYWNNVQYCQHQKCAASHGLNYYQIIPICAPSQKVQVWSFAKVLKPQKFPFHFRCLLHTTFIWAEMNELIMSWYKTTASSKRLKHLSVGLQHH